MDSPLIKATVQATLLGATSNILAQAITAYQRNVSVRPYSAAVDPQVDVDCPTGVLQPSDRAGPPVHAFQHSQHPS